MKKILSLKTLLISLSLSFIVIVTVWSIQPTEYKGVTESIEHSERLITKPVEKDSSEQQAAKEYNIQETPEQGNAIDFKELITWVLGSINGFIGAALGVKRLFKKKT